LGWREELVGGREEIGLFAFDVLLEQTDECRHRRPPVVVAGTQQDVHGVMIGLEAGDVLLVDVGVAQLGKHAGLLADGVVMEEVVEFVEEIARPLGVPITDGGRQGVKDAENLLVLGGERRDLWV
jgi:hypothetical protein